MLASYIYKRKVYILQLLREIFLFYLSYFLFLNISSNYFDLKNINLFLIIWFICGYVIGRYEFKIFKSLFIKMKFILNSLFLNLIFSYFFYLVFAFFIKIDTTQIKNKFLLIFFINSIIFEFIFNIFISKRTLKIKWLVIDNNNNIKRLKKEVFNSKNISIEFLESSKFNMKKFDFKFAELYGIVIPNYKSKKYYYFLNKLLKKSPNLKVLDQQEWLESEFNKIPSYMLNNNLFALQKIRLENSFQFRIKRIYEILISVVLIFLTLPIIFIFSILIYLSDGGSILYFQKRTGLNQRLFKIKKLRTMRMNAEENGPQWSERNDMRITKIGQIMRTLRIDELPQLFSVINGDMSLIGPRPERPEIDNKLTKKIPHYNLRYKIKPGLSGWAQVNYPYGASIEDARVKLSYDLYYIKNFSILLDCIIFFKTLKLVLNGRGSRPLIKK